MAAHDLIIRIYGTLVQNEEDLDKFDASLIPPSREELSQARLATILQFGGEMV